MVARPTSPIFTQRLLLRPIVAADAPALFAMDSDPEVHRFLGNAPVTAIAQIDAVIAFVQTQYATHGIGRWAVVLQGTGQCIGWAGLKYMTEPTHGMAQYYDLGYRLQRAYWGRGYATEAAGAWVAFAFAQLQLPTLYAMAHADNHASRHVLAKLGFQELDHFVEDGLPHVRLALPAAQWRAAPHA